MSSKITSEKDPCLKESRMSVDCLNRNFGDKSLCQNHLNNYKACKDFWYQVKSRRRAAGLTPALPPLEERPAFKAHYKATGQIPKDINP